MPGIGKHWRSNLRRCALVALSAVMSVAAIACGGAETGHVDLSNQTWLVPQDWDGIDPAKVSASNMGAILLVLEPLVLAQPNGGVKPNLATQATPDPLTYVYSLRPDAKFTDGSPVTADDVVYSYELHRQENSTSTLHANFATVKSVQATGDHEVTIKLTEPNVQFEYTAAQVGIVKKSVREALGDAAGSPDKLNVGSGPYVVDTYNPGALLVLKRNENYWGDKPEAKQLNLKLVTDDSARSMAVQSGSVTGAFDVPAAQANTYDGAGGMNVISGSNPAVMLFNVNLNVAPWNDVNVRRAVAQAIDKKGIVNAVLRGRGKPAVSVVDPKVMEGVLPADQVETLFKQLDTTPFDLEQARADLQKSAFPNGFKEKVIYSEVEPSAGLVAQAIAENLKPLGIILDVQSAPDAQYTDAVFFKHTAPASIVDFTTDTPDPVSLPNYLSNSAQTIPKGGYTDIADYVNPAQDDLLAQYLRTPSTDNAQRGALLSKI